jgi:hypothetical protein
MTLYWEKPTKGNGLAESILSECRYGPLLDQAGDGIGPLDVSDGIASMVSNFRWRCLFGW